MAVLKRKIDVTFSIAAMAGSDQQVAISAPRAHVSIESAGFPGLGELHMKLYGLNLDRLNQLSAFSPGAARITNNIVAIFAGDTTKMSLIYTGNVVDSSAKMNDQPDVCLEVVAQTSGALALIPIAPTSYPGGADAVSILKSLAAKAGLDFANHGVSGITLATPYYRGNTLTQIRACVEASHIFADISLNTLNIWPLTPIMPKDTSKIIEISTETGMIGYPDYNGGYVTITSLFNPSIFVGQIFKLKSSLTAASGIYSTMGVSHRISSETPNSPWFTSFVGYAFGN